MAKYDQGYLDGLLSLAQRRALTEREKRVLASMLAAQVLMRKHQRRARQIERRQIREQDGR